MAAPLDDIDRALLEVLRVNGRISIRALAQQANVSRASAYSRVDRMVAQGVITGFGAQIDPERCGLSTTAYITLKIEQNSWRRVHDRLRALPQVEHVALVGGEFDVVMLVRTADNRALRDLVFGELHAMPGVVSSRTLLVFDESSGRPAL